ncbi:putative nucleotidyltransferase, ribonuclease H [Tanacetum coccineum]
MVSTRNDAEHVAADSCAPWMPMLPQFASKETPFVREGKAPVICGRIGSPIWRRSSTLMDCKDALKTRFGSSYSALAGFLGQAAGTRKELANNFMMTMIGLERSDNEAQEWIPLFTLYSHAGNSGNGREKKPKGTDVCNPTDHIHLLQHMGRNNPGECLRATGTCFKCGQAGHLQRDYKKNTVLVRLVMLTRKPDASGRVCYTYLQMIRAANTFSTPCYDECEWESDNRCDLSISPCFLLSATIHDKTSTVSSIHDQPIVSEISGLISKNSWNTLIRELSLTLTYSGAEPISNSLSHGNRLSKRVEGSVTRLLVRGAKTFSKLIYDLVTISYSERADISKMLFATLSRWKKEIIRDLELIGYRIMFRGQSGFLASLSQLQEETIAPLGFPFLKWDEYPWILLAWFTTDSEEDTMLSGLKLSTAFHLLPRRQSESVRFQSLEDMLPFISALEWAWNWDDYIRNARAPIVGSGCETALEFHPGEHVFLKVSPTRGVRRFGIKGKLSPLVSIYPFEILIVKAYKYHTSFNSLYPFDQIREDLSYTEEPESILDRQDRVMRNKTIPFVKILWRNHPEREATWETEESIRTSYPHFFSTP